MSNYSANNIKSRVSLSNLRVEYSKTPLGIDVENPRFSWQMNAPEGERGYFQSAYQIIVKNPEGLVVWDTGKVESDISVGIEYGGKPLEATSRYTFIVNVWDQDGRMASESSWFETGLMNPDISAWDGAEWIGGGDDDLVLYSQYLSVFKVEYTVKIEEGSTRASFVLGANDSRLMDKNKNIYNIESGKDQSYIRFELDISQVDGSDTGLAKMNIYRVGYSPLDRADIPFKSLDIPLVLINNSNKHDDHDIYIWCEYGMLNIFIGGCSEENEITGEKKKANTPWEDTRLNINPIGPGNNYICFPMLADIGFYMGAGQKAYFSNLKVKHYRAPSNVIFSESLDDSYQGIYTEYIRDSNSGLTIDKDLAAYKIDGGSHGVIILADPSRNSMPMLRTEFTSKNKPIKKARLYVTARGIYELYINGERIGEDYFNPGLTQYNKTHMYQTYDVTNMLNSGSSNALGAWLGEGWWSGAITFTGSNWNYFGDRQSLLLKLVITYQDGDTDIITSNTTDWKYYNDGPLIYGSFFQGEVYDATKEEAIKGWNNIGYDDSDWKRAVEVPLDESTAFIGSWIDYRGVATEHNYKNMALIGQIGENAGVFRTLKAQSVDEVRKGVYVYDMGQNMVGVPRITIKDGVAGKKITLRYAEIKYPDKEEYGDNVGMIMLENIRAALAQDIYILKGGDEIIQPRFTFHGYRYIEITGIDEALPLDAVQGLVISSIKELTSRYKTSNEKVNRLWKNIVWSQLGNFLSIPTDCPQRNERMGWSGDISVFSRTATYIADVAQFLTRHMYAMRDCQQESGRFTDVAPLGGGFGGILWGSAGITVPWEVYQQYGDIRILQDNYQAMKRYIDYLDTRIDKDTGLLDEGPLGDWLSPENEKNEPVFLWTVYHVYDLWIMANVAEILDKDEDAKKFWSKYRERKEFFNRTFVDAVSRKTIKSDGVTIIDTQTSYAVPLALGVFSEENIAFAVEHLVEACRRENRDDEGMIRPAYSLMTGFIGTPWISKALSDYGYQEIAYRMLQQTSYPSWLYPVEQGATTIWERLNSYTKEDGFGGNNSMNSFNHYSFGAVGAWMINYSLGIQRDENNPAFKHFILQPTPDPDEVMTWAKGHYESMYGRIESQWKKIDKGYVYNITVPANTTATLYLIADKGSYVTEGGKPAEQAEGVKFIKQEDNKIVIKLESGSYKFIVSK